MARPDLMTASCRCVHFTDEEEFGAVVTTADGSGLLLMECDVSNVSGDDSLFRKLASAMSFPDYFGGNWDAVDECLRDLEWLSGKGYVLLVRNSHQLWSTSPGSAGSLIESWLFCAEEWASKGVPFHLVFLL
ncbi:MAG: barstar family protein [bacterium]|nr:barstar family protein [bacterium]